MTSSVNQRLKRKRRQAAEQHYREELEKLRAMAREILDQVKVEEVQEDEPCHGPQDTTCEVCGLGRSHEAT